MIGSSTFYWQHLVRKHLWLDATIFIMLLIHLAIIILGIFQLVKEGSEFIWAAPAALHITAPLVATCIILDAKRVMDKWTKVWFGSWGATNFVVAVVLLISGILVAADADMAVQDKRLHHKWLHMTECSIGIAPVCMIFGRLCWVEWGRRFFMDGGSTGGEELTSRLSLGSSGREREQDAV
jgi:hypothetical protein